MTNDYKVFISQVHSLVKKSEKERKLEIKKQDKLIKQTLEKAKKEAHILWRNSVYERDNWTCQLCGTSYKDKPNFAGLQPMHVFSKENYPQLRYDKNNGVSGCFYCHKNSPQSPHLDGFVFTHWLMKNKPEQYNYLITFLENLKPESPTKSSQAFSLGKE